MEKFEIEKQLAKEENIEGKILNFDDPKLGKSTPVRINKINNILGSGDCSFWIADTNIEVAEENKSDHHNLNVVLKKFRGGMIHKKDTNIERVSKELMDNYQTYKVFKTMGLPTFDTFRVNIEHGLALMTLKTKDGAVLLNTNDMYSGKDRAPFVENPIKEISNLDDFVEKLRSILNKTIANRFCPETSSYGIIFKPGDGTSGLYELDVMFVDFGARAFKRYDVDEYFDKEIIKDNLENLESALSLIFPGTDDEKSDFRKKVMDMLSA